MATSIMLSPIGRLRIETDPAGRLVTLDLVDPALGGQATASSGARAGAAANSDDPAATSAVVAAIDRYFSGEVAALDDVEVSPARGTDFQRAVWDELRRIPPGETISYAELAARIGRPTAVRAVGSANGANPIPVVVPCHRVVASGGGLGGYALGLDVKRWLLEHEAARQSLFAAT